MDPLPYLIAVTGSFGTGKNLVGDILKDLGFFVIDTDDVVRDILKDKNKVTDEIVKEFQESIINQLQGSKDSYIDRKALGNIVFNNEVKRKKLESIIHPQVRENLNKLFSLNKDKKIIFVLIPLLFEGNLQDSYHETWCVVCDENIQLDRLKNKGYSLGDAKVRIKSQFTQAEKARRADFVIDNSKDKTSTKEQVINRLKFLAESNRNLHASFYK